MRALFNRTTFFLLGFLSLGCILLGQEVQQKSDKRHSEKNAFGFQFKPIIPSSMFRITTNEIFQDGVIYGITPQTGYSAGATIRFGLSPRFIVQTDINYINRNFIFNVTDGNLSSDVGLKIISYEMPLLVTHFIRLSREVYMGQTLGLSFQYQPSNLYSNNELIKQHSLKKSWVAVSAVANIGFEWRTDEHGYFYIGPTYHMFFKPMFETGIYYKNYNNVNVPDITTSLRGDYFGIVLRYIFHPD